MKWPRMIKFAVLMISIPLVMGSEEDFLPWTSAVIECGRTAEAGEVSCEIEIGENGWEKFRIHAFGTTHTLSAADLKKLKEFPLSSLSTRHEAGYERIGGYTVHFRFDRTFYNADKRLFTEIIYVSVTKEGVTVSEPRTKESARGAVEIIPASGVGKRAH